ncbi:dihydrodipicolinate synthase family protein [Vibrio quintilis]|uniref:Putative 2-keto-3-deoxy-galactonate aldolase YagE n=1 Tax=Vibrio quintilis TaxID=1117707 RepID=A0A1M7YU91_9VIBR|nr:dihydrodipicolinate synthase family protein [Vibrio quintilis]SHO56237.1 putative 2-keto-3-deoxy-galactonate aldolase YagE [Vibrio quintilis]
MTTPVSGPHIAIVTPFDDQGNLNEQAMRQQVQRQISHGNKVFCNGTNGEFFVLNDQEKRRVTEICLEEAQHDDQVVTHIGEISLAQTIAHGKDAEQMGVKAVSVITPWFVALREKELIRYYQQVADSLSIPVYLYNIPARTGNTITPAIADVLATHPNIYGIKDSAGSLESLKGFLDVSARHDNFDVLNGPDSLILTGYQLGCTGCISGLGNIVPELVNQVWQSYSTDDQQQALQAQERISYLRANLFSIGFGPAVVKQALNQLGHQVGPSRYPTQFNEEEINQITKVLSSE